MQEIPQKESYGMLACNGVLFNHESPRRGETFVTRKITRGLARVDAGLDDCLYMGNLDSLRDWGHARDRSSAGLHQECPAFCAVCTELENSRWTDLARLCLARMQDAVRVHATPAFASWPPFKSATCQTRCINSCSCGHGALTAV